MAQRTGNIIKSIYSNERTFSELNEDPFLKKEWFTDSVQKMADFLHPAMMDLSTNLGQINKKINEDRKHTKRMYKQPYRLLRAHKMDYGIFFSIKKLNENVSEIKFNVTEFVLKSKLGKKRSNVKYYYKKVYTGLSIPLKNFIWEYPMFPSKQGAYSLLMLLIKFAVRKLKKEDKLKFYEYNDIQYFSIRPYSPKYACIKPNKVLLWLEFPRLKRN